MLVDKQIKELHQSIFLEGYNQQNVKSVSYDISINSIYTSSGERESTDLNPGEFVMIATDVKVHVPDNMVISVGQRNSRIRMGLLVDGPKYFPGHETVVFIRAINLSQNSITLKKGDGIAQLFFDILDEIPEVTYNNQPGNAFNLENSFRGLGNYKDELSSRITHSLDEARER